MQHLKLIPFIILFITFSCNDGDELNCQGSECFLLIEDRVYGIEDDNLKEIDTYEYSASEKLLKKEKTTGDGNFILSDTYVYDDSDNLIEHRYRYLVSYGNRTSYYTIENNLRIREDLHDDNGNLLVSIHYSYDTNNKLVATEYCDISGESCYTYHEYIYDNGLLIEENEYDFEGGDLDRRVSYTYNENDLLVEEIHHNLVLSTITRTLYYTYNEQEQLIHLVNESGTGEINYEISYTYDECGREISKISNSPTLNEKTINMYNCI